MVWHSAIMAVQRRDLTGPLTSLYGMIVTVQVRGAVSAVKANEKGRFSNDRVKFSPARNALFPATVAAMQQFQLRLGLESICEGGRA